MLKDADILRGCCLTICNPTYSVPDSANPLYADPPEEFALIKKLKYFLSYVAGIVKETALEYVARSVCESLFKSFISELL